MWLLLTVTVQDQQISDSEWASWLLCPDLGDWSATMSVDRVRVLLTVLTTGLCDSDCVSVYSVCVFDVTVVAIDGVRWTELTDWVIDRVGVTTTA